MVRKGSFQKQQILRSIPEIIKEDLKRATRRGGQEQVGNSLYGFPRHRNPLNCGVGYLTVVTAK